MSAPSVTPSVIDRLSRIEFLLERLIQLTHEPLEPTGSTAPVIAADCASELLIAVREIRTGTIRVYRCAEEGDIDFMSRCDCNRAFFYEHAVANPVPPENGYPCGRGKYEMMVFSRPYLDVVYSDPAIDEITQRDMLDAARRN